MKNSLLLKFLIVLPLIVFIDFVVLTAFGCFSAMAGATDSYFCGPYCLVSKVLLAVSGLFFVYLILTDIMKKHPSKLDGQTS
jgi:predicted tellurium resistance membrane protein TerC